MLLKLYKVNATVLLAGGLVLGGLFTSPHAEETQVNVIKDIRILVDVSGSMKWNDPDNLRIPAVRLLTGLLPAGMRAGVWTFGRYVNMLVPLGTVDASWKEGAGASANEIHSRGLFTNIETALEKSTWDWKRPDPRYQRSLILLTDGIVDISRDHAQNEASRARILETILPRLQRAEVAIQTIALGDKTDEILLEQLATATNGHYQKAETAEKLERIFLHHFEEAAAPDALPLENNRVEVDESIQELTLLVFRKKDGPPTRIIAPDRGDYAQHKLAANIRWHHEANYDLITIDKPQPGTWNVVADVDPDNRVLVVTNLRMVSTPLPANIGAHDHFDFQVQLMRDDRIIRQKDFLHLIKITLQQDEKDGEHRQWSLLDDGEQADKVAGDGIYSLLFGDSLRNGQYELTLNVDGATFKRVRHQTVNVFASPVMATFTPPPADESRPPVLTVTPRAGMINPDTLRITATISSDGGEKQTLTVPRANPNEWRWVPGNNAAASYAVELDIEAEKPDGEPLRNHIGPLYYGEVNTRTHKNNSGAAPLNADPGVEQPTPPAPARGYNWVFITFQVVLLNALVGAGLYFGYRKWRSMMRGNVFPWDELAHE